MGTEYVSATPSVLSRKYLPVSRCVVAGFLLGWERGTTGSLRRRMPKVCFVVFQGESKSLLTLLPCLSSPVTWPKERLEKKQFTQVSTVQRLKKCTKFKTNFISLLERQTFSSLMGRCKEDYDGNILPQAGFSFLFLFLFFWQERSFVISNCSLLWTSLCQWPQGHKIDAICPKQLTVIDNHFVFFTG